MMNTQTETLNQPRYLRIDDVLAIFPVSKSTWWAGIQEGHFPKPVKLSANITAWRTEDIEALFQKINETREG